MLCGDEEAFRQIYRALQPGLLRYLTVLLGPNDAEDMASETWAQAVRDLARFQGDADGFRGWITTIARHRAMDLLRAKGRRPVADLPIEDFGDRAAREDTEADAWESMSTAAALRLIRTLPAEQAEAILLRTVIGLDAKSAARILGRRPGAVRTAAYRGLRSLARQMDDSSRGVPRAAKQSVMVFGDTPRRASAEELT